MRGNILYRLIYSGVLRSAQFYLFMWLFWRTPSTLKIAKSSPPLFLVDAAEIERHGREAILGGSGGSATFVHSGMILSSNFVSFWRHFFGILSFDFVNKYFQDICLKTVMIYMSCD